MLGFMRLCAPLVRWLVLRWCCAGALVLRWCCAGAALHDGRYSAFIVIGVTFLKATAFVSTITPKTQPPPLVPSYPVINLLLAQISFNCGCFPSAHPLCPFFLLFLLHFCWKLERLVHGPFVSGISYKSVRRRNFVQVRSSLGFRTSPFGCGIPSPPSRLWDFVPARSSLEFCASPLVSGDSVAIDRSVRMSLKILAVPWDGPCLGS